MAHDIKVNPLAVLNIREVKIPPVHFSYTLIEFSNRKCKIIEAWIINNLKSRYYLNMHIHLINNEYQTMCKIGFENPNELTLFLLGCPHLNSTKT
jgi:hypothetical protein